MQGGAGHGSGVVVSQARGEVSGVVAGERAPKAQAGIRCRGLWLRRVAADQDALGDGEIDAGVEQIREPQFQPLQVFDVDLGESDAGGETLPGQCSCQLDRKSVV